MGRQPDDRPGDSGSRILLPKCDAKLCALCVSHVDGGRARLHLLSFAISRRGDVREEYGVHSCILAEIAPRCSEPGIPPTTSRATDTCERRRCHRSRNLSAKPPRDDHRSASRVRGRLRRRLLRRPRPGHDRLRQRRKRDITLSSRPARRRRAKLGYVRPSLALDLVAPFPFYCFTSTPNLIPLT